METKQGADDATLLELKADEFIVLLRKGVVDASRAKAIKQKLLNALDQATLPQRREAIKDLDTDKNRLESSNKFEYLLSQHQLDSVVAKKFMTPERLRKGIVLIIGVIMITLGMAMIIMPAPPYFEMFTVFHFSDNDGVTIMDILSLLIVFTGVYLLLSSVIKRKAIN